MIPFFYGFTDFCKTLVRQYFSFVSAGSYGTFCCIIERVDRNPQHGNVGQNPSKYVICEEKSISDYPLCQYSCRVIFEKSC